MSRCGGTKRKAGDACDDGKTARESTLSEVVERAFEQKIREADGFPDFGWLDEHFQFFKEYYLVKRSMIPRVQDLSDVDTAALFLWSRRRLPRSTYFGYLMDRVLQQDDPSPFFDVVREISPYRSHLFDALQDLHRMRPRPCLFTYTPYIGTPCQGFVEQKLGSLLTQGFDEFDLESSEYCHGMDQWTRDAALLELLDRLRLTCFRRPDGRITQATVDVVPDEDDPRVLLVTVQPTEHRPDSTLVVRWNLDKHRLADMDSVGCELRLPTATYSDTDLRVRLFDKRHAPRLVVSNASEAVAPSFLVAVPLLDAMVRVGPFPHRV